MKEYSPECIFEPDALQEGFGPEPLAGYSNVLCNRIQANASRLSRGELHLSDSWNALIVNVEGTYLLQTNSESVWNIVTPRSFMFARHVTMDFVYGRGSHLLYILMWRSELCKPLEDWLDRLNGGKQGKVHVSPIDPTFREAFDRFEGSVNDQVLGEPRTFGVIYDVVPQVVSLTGGINLTPLPAELPDTISALIKKVIKNPAASWPLKDAADQAGYSPFHFSRVFKSMVGYGFHEYVDRCRTAVAVEMLMSGDKSVDTIASATGFGTTQGLRESVKEYLGLVPSELRLA